VSIEHLITEHLDIWTAADTEKKSGRGRGSANSGNVYGIKKLRELILELAVRGKLVQQDPNDEPASELLKRIQVEKAKLIAEGKIKKSKSLAEITDDEKPFELPVGWEWSRLNTLCVLENGDRGKNYPNKSALVEAGIPFINAGHLQNGLIDKNQMTFITKEHFDILRGGKFQENDILFCLRGSLGKSALVKELEAGAIASSLVIIRLFPNLDATYFVNYFDCLLST
jgi:type I restriction enzyme S subunit